MKTYDLKPTFENLLDTYKRDVIGRNSDIFRFTEILNSVEDGCSIALDGNWGSGKTFFVKQVKMVMDAHNSFVDHNGDGKTDEIVSVRKNHYRDEIFDLQPQVCVYYDAWENDNDEDPVMSLVYAILSSVDTDFDFKDTNFIKTGASIMEVFSGRSWTQLIENLKGTSPLDVLKGHKDVDVLVEEFLNSLIPEKGNRLIVFIDELDRCKPSYAVRLLERIKHYFSNGNITFVFSVNINELQHTIRKFYGDDFNGTRYLDRFFDLKVTLPPPNLQGYYSSLDFNDSYYTYDIVCGEVIKAYHFGLREIAKYLRLTKIAAYAPTHDNSYNFSFSEGKALQFCLLYIIPIMIGLKTSDTKRYAEFIEGRDHTPLVEIANALKIRIFDELLDRNETYDAQATDRTVVTLEDKLKAVYDALFVTTYGGEIYSVKIGEMQFNTSTKDTLLRITGLLSRYTKLDVD